MSEQDRFLELLRMPNSDRAILLLTFTLTVLVDLTVAIGVGVTLASLLFVARMSDTVSIDSGNTTGPDEADQRAALPADVEVFRVDGPFFFGVAAGLMDAYRKLGRIPRVLIVRLENVPVLDASGAAAIGELVSRAGTAGTRVIVCTARPDVIAMLARARIDDQHGLLARTVTYADAIARARMA